MQYLIAALYHFAPINNLDATQKELLELCQKRNIKGTLLLANEGINGTVAGSRSNIDALLAHVRGMPGFANLEHKESFADKQVFGKLKVRQKPEIVTLGQPLVNPQTRVGQYVQAKDWNNFLAQDDVILIDTRNDFEVEIGTFKNALNPNTKSFREFPLWWQEHAHEFDGKKIAMFCTGGIRCEKSTSWLRSQGLEDVYHLKGGILKYLEEIPAKDSLWQGECFVFDERVSLDHDLNTANHVLCKNCGRPTVKTEDVQFAALCEYCSA